LSLAILILAGGDESGMRSRHPRALHAIGGKTLLAHALDVAARIASSADLVVVTGSHGEKIGAAFKSSGIRFVAMEDHAGYVDWIVAAREILADYENVLVLDGNRPLIRHETLAKLLEHHALGGMMTTLVVAHETQTGVFVAKVKPLLARLSLKNDSDQTALAKNLAQDGEAVNTIEIADGAEFASVDSIADLVRLDALIRLRTAERLIASGVTILKPETSMIDAGVEIGADTILEPNVQILGNTRIGDGCRIRSGSVIENSTLADGVLIRHHCVVTDSTVATGANIGPFAHLRPGSEIGEEVHIGNFVETKKARLGKGVKAGHLSYLGDAEIGAGTNIGAGVITCNYDGVHKHRTQIGEGSFIGSDSTLVAPVTIGERAYIGAGSCITREVPAGSLAVARSRQVTKEGWADAKRAEQASECGD
jgi:bifunctional UDP-N-acetylglucosamine pyrophosphorylase/glucosamine-1-phosphate N-acetyltransferase